jgi:hypothetical protein
MCQRQCRSQQIESGAQKSLKYHPFVSNVTFADDTVSHLLMIQYSISACKERKGKERKGKERKGKERKGELWQMRLRKRVY